MTTSSCDRPPIPDARRVVLKVGTSVLTKAGGSLALSRLFSVVEAAASLRARGKDVLLVSSGAVGIGLHALGLRQRPVELGERQACAAVGQSRLMGLYNDGFAQLGLVSAQVLLTQGDFESRVRYLNLRTTLTSLLRHGAIPVINENDVVATDELEFVEGTRQRVFGDNDRLSALVATKLNADLLVLLTDVDGVLDADPRINPGARLVPTIDRPSLLDVALGDSASGVGRGGMRSKVEAAALAQRGGCHGIIASGLDTNILRRVLDGEALGTWFPAHDALGARRRWIAFAAIARGTLAIDAGAVNALVARGASLLASGVTSVVGDFREGDVVEIRGPDGTAMGRGMISCDAPTARAWCSGSPPAGIRNHHALLQRDLLVLDS